MPGQRIGVKIAAGTPHLGIEVGAATEPSLLIALVPVGSLPLVG
ncbi:MAG: hypothetical protein ACJ77F_07395 [Chloroflexota bacterium]